jgi:hypothetical protein
LRETGKKDKKGLTTNGQEGGEPVEMETTISLTVSVDEEGANLNEICAAVRKTVVGEVACRVAERIVAWLQEEVRDGLTKKGRRRRRGGGRHERPGKGACRTRRCVKEGYRPEPRRVKTDLGEIRFPVGYVSCVGCGKKWAPILGMLGLAEGKRHSTGLEKVVAESVMETSYGRGEAEVEARGSPPVPRSSAHRWVAMRKLEAKTRPGIEFGMGDGTGFKQWPGKRGELRVVIGLDRTGTVFPLGTYAGKSWEEIGQEVRKKLKAGPGGPVQLKLFAADGEAGLDAHLVTMAEYGQRCVWHVPRDLGYAMWKQDAPKSERDEMRQRLANLVGIEVPAEDWEAVSEDDKAALEASMGKNEQAIRQMAQAFHQKGYTKAAAYLENAVGNLFSHLRLWLKTGIVAPRTTSILENIMRELGRRIKKLGWNWSDPGVVRMAGMIMLRRYDEEQWNAYWNEALDLRGRCQIVIRKITVRRKAA